MDIAADPSSADHRRRWLTVLGLGLLGAASCAPLLLEGHPREFLAPYSSAVVSRAARAGVLAVFTVVIACSARGRCGGPVHQRTAVLAGLGLLLTLEHHYEVDLRPNKATGELRVARWQRDIYLAVLNSGNDPRSLAIPHAFRPLPYGFVRSLEWVTRDWPFSCLAYRWFFSFWLLWGAYELAGRRHGHGPAWLAVAVVVVLYPLSIRYYMGQLTDPQSHALLVLSFLFLLEDRWLALALALGLGMAAKETAVVLVPAYLGCRWRQGWPALGRTLVLGLIAVGVFLAVRLPLGWSPGAAALNGVGVMAGTNLGLGKPLAHAQAIEGPALLNPNLVQPLVFFVPVLMLLAWNWPRTDPLLRRLALIATPLVFAGSLCFGWLYESRNYLPLLPLLLAAALPVRR